MPLRQRLGQLLMVPVPLSGPNAGRALVRATGVGGLVVLTGSATIVEQGALKSLTGPTGIPTMVAVDEEGGRVQRLKAIIGSIPSARVTARTMTTAQVRTLARSQGQGLRRLGVTVDFAPVVDVSNQPDNEVIGDRSFSNVPATVVRYASSFAQGLRDAGVLPVFKHFPGHGHARGDSHKGAAVTPPLSAMGGDLLPYHHLTSAGGVMVGHLDVPGLTAPGIPTSVSPAAIRGLLRTTLRFNGLVFTDDLSGMKAITGRFTTAEAARRSLAAGADIALVASPIDVASLLNSLVQDVRIGSLSVSWVNTSVVRVLAAKHFNPCQ